MPRSIADFLDLACDATGNLAGRNAPNIVGSRSLMTGSLPRSPLQSKKRKLAEVLSSSRSLMIGSRPRSPGQSKRRRSADSAKPRNDPPRERPTPTVIRRDETTVNRARRQECREKGPYSATDPVDKGATGDHPRKMSAVNGEGYAIDEHASLMTAAIGGGLSPKAPNYAGRDPTFGPANYLPLRCLNEKAGAAGVPTSTVAATAAGAGQSRESPRICAPTNAQHMRTTTVRKILLNLLFTRPS